MRQSFCGLDFGTSNSTIGISEDNTTRLAPVEGTQVTIPTALFYSFEEDEVFFGRKAISEYADGAEGRLMRALKSVLGSSLVHDKAQIKYRSVPFIDIIGTFVAHLKEKAELELGGELADVVLGRPVYFVDDRPDADSDAQNQLEDVARKQGFRNIAFQFEPIAAALDYEQQVLQEQLAFIVDIGGGTADFSIVRVSPERIQVADRKDDILANLGVHIGGTDFDRLLSLAKIMPHLGYKSPQKNGKTDVPSFYFQELATWQRINWLYNKKTMTELRQVRYEAEQPELIERLIAVIEGRQGHALASRVENAKIALTQEVDFNLDLALLAGHLQVPVSRDDFTQIIDEAVGRITSTVTATLGQARLQAPDIQAVFLTGGSTQIPFVKESILAMFPGVTVVEGDMFGSVGLGLALDARRKFA